MLSLQPVYTSPHGVFIDHKPYKPSIKPVAVACALNNIWPLVYLGLSVTTILIFALIGCYLQYQWPAMSECSSKELALGTTAIILELFICYLIVGK